MCFSAVSQATAFIQTDPITGPGQRCSAEMRLCNEIAPITFHSSCQIEILSSEEGKELFEFGGRGLSAVFTQLECLSILYLFTLFFAVKPG